MATPRLLPRILRLTNPQVTPIRPSLLRLTHQQQKQPKPLQTLRFKHTIPRPSSTPPPAPQPTAAAPKDQDPTPQTESESKRRAASYELTFTCKPCSARSRHTISKQGYHHGSVLVTCPSCRNRHVISDHLKIFGDKSMTIEDLLRERGQLVRKGSLAEDGDLEFWEDGTVTAREEDGEKILRWEKRDGEPDTSAPGSSFKSVKPEGGQ
ncbi:hypothetical protein OQA88_1693 [Cercophora sp. LCS_1]